jgi:DNA-binding HxlR family transcriptional regulator
MTNKKQAALRSQVLLALAKKPMRYEELRARIGKASDVRLDLATLIQLMENNWVQLGGGADEMEKRIKESRAWQKWFLGDQKKPAPHVGPPAKYQLTPRGREIVDLLKSKKS